MLHVSPPRADLLAPDDPPLGPHLDHPRLGADGVQGVAGAGVVHHGVGGVDHRALGLALTQTDSIHSLKINNYTIHNTRYVFIASCKPSVALS